MEDKASDAYYKLSNPKAQIQSYVFDGKNNTKFLQFRMVVQTAPCVEVEVKNKSSKSIELDHLPLWNTLSDTQISDVWVAWSKPWNFDCEVVICVDFGH